MLFCCMDVVELALTGLKLLKPTLFRDERGFFYESYRNNQRDALDLPEFVQGNCSHSKAGVVRGLHYQTSPGQAKLVSCVKGKIFDVAVDLRCESKTFGMWHSVILSEQDPQMFFIPVGFAHGFCALEDALVIYDVSAYYDAATEMTIRWNDPTLNIAWPIQNGIVSKRDQNAPFFNEVFSAYLGNGR